MINPCTKAAIGERRPARNSSDRGHDGQPAASSNRFITAYRNHGTHMKIVETHIHANSSVQLTLLGICVASWFWSVGQQEEGRPHCGRPSCTCPPRHERCECAAARDIACWSEHLLGLEWHPYHKSLDTRGHRTEVVRVSLPVVCR